MKYAYITATGKTEIEVDEQFYDLLITMDHEEYNADRKHSRRHPIALDAVGYEGLWLSDNADLLGDLIRAESHDRLRAALQKLSPEQQMLIKRIYFKNEKIVNIARMEGVSEAAVRNRLKKIYARLNKILI